MPVVSLTLEDTNRSILSSAYFKIIQDIVESIKIPYSTLVVMHRDMESTLTDNKTNVSGLSQDNLPSTVSKRRIIASITEEYNEDELTTTAIHQLSSYPIFQDLDVNVFVYPIYIKSDINIEFSYISPSKIEANRIRDDIRIRLSQTRNINIHDIDYDILIPEIVEDFITDVYELKNRLVPQSLEDYFREHSTKRIHLLTDLSNKENSKLAISEKQIRIVGLFDFSSMPEKIEVDNNNYKVTFNYKLTLDVPRAIVLRYPVMICNKTLPSKYLQFIEDSKIQSKEEYKKDVNYINNLRELSYFEAHRQLENRVDIKLPMNIPLFDDFNIREGHKGYCIIISFLTDINETDKKTLFNLRDIEPYYFDSTILNFILNGEKNYIINPYMSFLYLGLYQDDVHFDNNILEIDNDLNIKSKVELSLFKPTRVVLSFILDITALDNRAITRLLTNKDILYIFIQEYIYVYNNYKTELSRNIIPDNTFYKTLTYILYHFIKIDDLDALLKIFNLLKIDNYIYNNLISILKNNYPNIFFYINNNNLIDLTNVNINLNIHHTNIENYSMRTVMSDYIVALRQDK